MDEKIATLLRQLNPKNTKTNEPLSGYTNLKIGGPADILYIAHDIKDLINVVSLAKRMDIPVTVLGRGTNILISDDGIRGLVVINKANTINIAGEKPVSEDAIPIIPRWESDSQKGTFKYEFKDLDYDETGEARVEVIIDSGVDLPFALRYLLDKNITGLQWYAGIPGTIGGAIYNNIHGGTHFLSEVVKKVKILDKDLHTRELDIKELGADYDKSRFHNSGEVILQGTFNLYRGDVEKAKFTAREWAERKKIQPRNSPGCCFANLTQEQKEKFEYPTTAMGYVIEHVFKMTGFKIGDAAVSKAHHNFIVNEGKATARDYLAVMKEIYKRTKETLDIEIVPEIMLLGFKDEEIKEFTKKEQEELRKVRNEEIRTVYK
ncbi:MAG: FAD-binding protein [Candidatus Dojkabacteria bacterium]|nr:FAD-binding protein [Candidatus Dojkabacteria bacterium]